MQKVERTGNPPQSHEGASDFKLVLGGERIECSYLQHTQSKNIGLFFGRPAYCRGLWRKSLLDSRL